MNTQCQFSSESAFSLLELGLVLLSTFLLIGLAIPSVEQIWHEWNLLGAARMLESSLQWGRFHAISENVVLRIEIDGDRRGFYWEDSDTGERFLQATRRLPGNLRFENIPSRAVRFHPRGNAAPAGSFVLKGRRGTYRVIVNPGGRIRIQKG